MTRRSADDSRSHLQPTPGEIIQPLSTRRGIIAALAGLVTGAAAGLIGVGGGEFRIPVLVHLLGIPLRPAGGVNLVIGLFTVSVGVLRRWGQHGWTREDLVLVGIMGAVSLLGAAVGVLGRGKLPFRPLKWILCAYLVLVGVWMIYEAITHVEHVLLDPHGLQRWLLASVVAFVIAVASGVLGVAGGEMRIPALLYLFAIPIREAGTLSLAISVPTVAAGALTDRHLGHVPSSALTLVILMGLGSVAGVLVGTVLLPYVDRDGLKAVLGVILLAATVRVTTAVQR